jgi:exo-beta-1,3-glucanase (GH17 family)
MNYTDVFSMPPAAAVCYSGYREGQQPGINDPSYEQVKEDLLIVQANWTYVRLYSCDSHSRTVLEVIEKEKLPLKVMLGAYINAEQNNPNCPWGGNDFSEEALASNKEQNHQEVDELVRLANRYPAIIFSLSVGNEASVDWTDHMVAVSQIIYYVRQVKKGAKQPVTFCENYVPWLDKLEPLVNEVDFISIHTYPVWEYKTIDESLEFTKQNYRAVAEKYPNKLVVITEAGWATSSNDQGIPKANVNQIFQKIYYQELSAWCKQDHILTFVFEAFDEPWKGSPDPNEPEKHWGLYYENRTPKLAFSEDIAYKGSKNR